MYIVIKLHTQLSIVWGGPGLCNVTFISLANIKCLSVFVFAESHEVAGVVIYKGDDDSFRSPGHTFYDQNDLFSMVGRWTNQGIKWIIAHWLQNMIRMTVIKYQST